MNNFGQLYGRSMAAMAALCPAWAGGFEALPRHEILADLAWFGDGVRTA